MQYIILRLYTGDKMKLRWYPEGSLNYKEETFDLNQGQWGSPTSADAEANQAEALRLARFLARFTLGDKVPGIMRTTQFEYNPDYFNPIVNPTKENILLYRRNQEAILESLAGSMEEYNNLVAELGNDVVAL